MVEPNALEWWIRVTVVVSWWADDNYHYGGRVTVERIQEGGGIDREAGAVVQDLIAAAGTVLGIPEDADLTIRVGQFQR